MPLALVLGFKFDMGVRGFWMAFTCALALQDLIITMIIFCTDWDEAGRKANAEDGEVGSSDRNKKLLMDDETNGAQMTTRGHEKLNDSVTAHSSQN